MSYTSQLKKVVDLPVWEWCRFAPVTTGASSCLTSSDGRYMYYMSVSSGTLYRYDIVSDGWQELESSLLVPSVGSAMKFSPVHGYHGRVISAGPSTIQAAALNGKKLKGYKIKIISGTGVGQERMITDVSEATIHQTFTQTTASSTSITDSSQSWRTNQWVGYQLRIAAGVTQSHIGQTRKIVANNATTILLSDNTHYSLSPWTWGGALVITPTSTVISSIESSTITVDSPWTIQPDSTSEFMVMSGAVFFVFGAPSTTSGVQILYYDVVSDTWYYKMTPINFYSGGATQGVCSIEHLYESTILLSNTATSATSKTIKCTALDLAVNDYANHSIRIISGVGIGQTRSIIANSSDEFYIDYPWVVTPDNTSIFEVTHDADKIYLVGAGNSCPFVYSIERDMWSFSQFFDWGVPRSISVKKQGVEPIGATAITRTTGGILTINATPTAAGSGYSVGNLLTVSTGGTNGKVRVMEVNATGGVTSVSLENGGATYTVGTGRATTNSGSGTGCTIEIIAISDMANVTTLVNHPLKIGDTVTITGAVQSQYNGTQTILGADSNNVFMFPVSGTPATPATFTAQTTSLLVDMEKNWTNNEHVGKYLLLQNNGSGAGSFSLVKIASNTSNTITTLVGLASTPVTTSKYAIVDMRFFGNESLYPMPEQQGDGIATSGTNSTLVDTRKNWVVNSFSNKKVRIIAGTGTGQEVTITSNTSNTLTISGTWSVNPDNTSVYSVEDCYGIITTGGSTTTLTDSTQNWPTNWLAPKKIRATSSGVTAAEATIASNTSTTVTFSTLGTTVANTPYSIIGVGNSGAGVESIWAKKHSRGRYIYLFRGNGTNIIDKYNISSGRYEGVISAISHGVSIGNGTMYAYDGDSSIYIQINATGRVLKFDLNATSLECAGVIPYGMGTGIASNRMEIITTEDGLKFLYLMRHNGQEFFRTLLWY